MRCEVIIIVRESFTIVLESSDSLCTSSDNEKLEFVAIWWCLRLANV